MFHIFQSGSIKIRMGESREWGLLGVVCGQGWRAGPLPCLRSPVGQVGVDGAPPSASPVPESEYNLGFSSGLLFPTTTCAQMSLQSGRNDRYGHEVQRTGPTCLSWQPHPIAPPVLGLVKQPWALLLPLGSAASRRPGCRSQEHRFSGVPRKGPILCKHCVTSLGACAPLFQLQWLCNALVTPPSNTHAQVDWGPSLPLAGAMARATASLPGWW